MRKYESHQDVMRGVWRVERAGNEAIGDCSFRLEFTVGRPVADTWKHMKDFNSWMEDLHFNSVVGDEGEGSSIYFTIRDSFYEEYRKNYGISRDFRKDMILRRNVPGKLLVKEELSEDKRKIAANYIYALSDHDGKTVVTGLFAYAPEVGPMENEEQMRAGYQFLCDEIESRWKTKYIPRLRQLVEGG